MGNSASNQENQITISNEPKKWKKNIKKITKVKNNIIIYRLNIIILL
jgi:hypothetical protein